VAADGDWMLTMLESVLPYDDFTSKLVGIYKKIKSSGQPQQPIHLGINRSDYMLNGKVITTAPKQHHNMPPSFIHETTMTNQPPFSSFF